MRRSYLAMLLLILLLFTVSILIYPFLPARLATHWGTQGQVNGYMSRVWGAFFTPLLSLALVGLLLLLGNIDPKKQNLKESYDYLIIAFLIFMLYVHLLVLLANLGITFNMGQLLAPGLGVLFILIGLLLPKQKQNYTFGIRTPWALANEKVWARTHEYGGKLFVIAGIIACFGVVFPSLAFLLVIVPVLLAALGSVVYSYLVFRKLKK
jgi:uncharacterized membrane protein